MRRSAVLLLSIVLIVSAVSAPAAGQSADYSGEVVLSGDAAADGTNYQYELSQDEDFKNLSVEFEGVINANYDNVTANKVKSGETVNLDVGGNIDPSGPSGDPVVQLAPPKDSPEITFDDANDISYFAKDGSTTSLGVTVGDISGIGDIDGNGQKEIAFTESGNIKYTTPSGSITDLSVSFNNIGGSGDVDGDGRMEIVFAETSNSDISYVDESGSVTTLGGDGSDDIYGVGDLDGDGKDEIVYSPSSSSLKYIDNGGSITDISPSDYERGGAVGDIDGDGKDEAAYFSSNQEVKYVNADGSESAVLATDGGNLNDGSLPYQTGDINQDGDVEIVYQDINGELDYVDNNGDETTISANPPFIEGLGAVGNVKTETPTDPAIDIDGDSQDEISISGELTSTTTKSIPSLSLSDDTATVSLSDGSVNLDFGIEEQTQTVDPSITVNGNSSSYQGSLSDGSTTTLDVSDSWLTNGTNNLSVSTNSPTNGPGSLVKLDYRHETTGPSQSTSVSSTEWESEINSSRSYQSDRSNVVANLRFADDVISVDAIEYRINNGSWTTPPSWSMSGSDLSVEIGSVDKGDHLTVRAEGRRVNILNGDVEITDPTTQGDKLDSKIKVTTRSDNFGIDTSGTSDRIHYAAQESWDSSEYVEIDSTGDQIIRLPNAADGSTARIRRAPLSMSSSGDPVAVRLDDPDTPAWSVTDQASTPDNIQIDYLDPDPLTEYQIYSLSEERSLRTAEEDGGVVSFTADGRTGSYEIRESISTSGAAVAVAGDGGGSSPLSIVALLVGLGGSLVGTLILGRRLGIGGTRTRLGIGLVLGIVGVELATARSVIGDVIFGISRSIDEISSSLIGGSGSIIGGFLDSGAGVLVLGILILIGLVILRRRVGLPDWLLVSGGLLTGIFVIDEISGGLLTGALDELGPLVWILLLLGGGVLLYRVLAPRPINIGGGGSS